MILRILAFVALAAPAFGQTWTNVLGGNWGTASNWSTGNVPGASATATFNTLGGAYTVTLTDSRTVNIIQMLSSDTTINVGSFSSLTATTINVTAGAFNLTAGTLTIGSSFNVGSGGSAVFSGGGLTGAGTLTGLMVVNGSLNMGNSAANPLVNAGTLLWQSGVINNSFGYTLANTGILELSADGVAFGSSSGNTLINRGTIRKSGGLFGSSDIGASINFLGSTSVVETTVGLLRFTGGGVFAGTTTFIGGGTAALASGGFSIATGTSFNPVVGSGGNALEWRGGVLFGGGTLAGTLVANYSAGGSVPFRVDTAPTAPLILTGVFVWKQGSISSWTNGGIANTTGIIDFLNDGVAFTTLNTGYITNFATLRKSSGSLGSTDIGFSVNLTGPNSKIEVLTGILNLNGGGTLSGTTTITGPGIVALNGGAFTISTSTSFTAQTGADGANLNWTGGVWNGGGTLRGALVVSGSPSGTSSGGTMRIDSPASTPLLNAAQIIWQSGTIGSYSSGVLVNTTGTISFAGDGAAFSSSPNTGSIQNQSSIIKSAGLTTTTVGWPVTNSATGIISNNRSNTTLAFNAGVTNTGTITMVSGATVSGPIISNSGGIVQGPASGSGNYSGALTFNAGSTLKPGGGQPGRLNLGSGLIMATGSKFSARLTGTTPIIGYAQVNVTGAVQLNGAIIELDTTGWNATVNDKIFPIVNDGSDAIVGTFAGLPNGSTVNLPNGGTALISYSGNYELGQTTTGGNDVVLYGFSAVPEPVSVFTVGIGLLCIRTRFRR